MSGRIVCGVGFIASRARGAESGLFDRTEQDSVGIQHDGARRWRIGTRRRDDVVGTEAGEVVAHEFVDAHAIRVANPERTHARRKIVDEIWKRAHPL